MKRSSKVASALLVFGSLTFLLPVVGGQTQTAARGILLAMAANAKRVVQYDWKQRITVTRKGRPSEPVIDQVHFDSSGKMQRTTISAPEQKGGIRGRIAAGVKEDVKGIMEEVGQYNKPQQMVEAVRKAQTTSSSTPL